MNKDVTHITPEDDITDVISQLKNAKEKIVAIVPPQPAGIFRSAVNIKLIKRTADEAEKVAVLVTADPALLKLAAVAKMPVAESLQSAPVVPTEEDLAKKASTPEKEAKIAEDFAKNKPKERVLDSDEVEQELSKKETTKDQEDSALEEKKGEKDWHSTTKNKFLRGIYDKFPWVEKNRKILFPAIIVLILLVGFCIWAFGFAPAVDITLNIKASGNNFSENATFTTKTANVDASAGKFLMKEEKYETESKTSFKATGSKDMGDKASGTVKVSVFFGGYGAVTIPANTTFTYSGMNYMSTQDVTIRWAEGDENCENKSNPTALVTSGCQISGEARVVAAEPGSKYNLDAGKKDWSLGVSIKADFVRSTSVENTQSISGGSTKMVTIVQQSDVDTALKTFKTIDETEGKLKLAAQIADDVFVLTDTYASNIGSPVISPRVGEVVADGVTPTITASAVFTVYSVAYSDIEQFIQKKATLGSDQMIYSLGEPFVEKMNGSGDTYTGKLKTTYKTGPKITEEEVREKVYGRKIGEAQSLLKSINGVETVNIVPSFFWVNRVPTTEDRVKIQMKIDGEDYKKYSADHSSLSNGSNSDKTTSESSSSDSSKTTDGA